MFRGPRRIRAAFNAAAPRGIAAPVPPPPAAQPQTPRKPCSCPLKPQGRTQPCQPAAADSKVLLCRQPHVWNRRNDTTGPTHAPASRCPHQHVAHETLPMTNASNGSFRRMTMPTLSGRQGGYAGKSARSKEACKSSARRPHVDIRTLG